MKPEEIKILGDKITDGSASQAERLAFLKELNKSMKEIRRQIARAKEAKNNHV